MGGRLRSRNQTPLECFSNLVNILLQILCYPTLVWILPSNLEVKTKKIKEGLHRKVLCYLITFTRPVLLFHRKRAFVVTCFKAKVCWSSCTSTKVYSRLGGRSSNFGDTAQKTPPCIGVDRIFDWGEGQPKMTCNAVIRNFRKRNFLGDKDIVECMIRSRGLVWHLTKSFQKGEA